MAFPVLIYCTDRSRGGILNKILKRNDISATLVKHLEEMQTALSRHQPDVFIVDLKNEIRDEIVFLAKLCQKLEQPFLIVLGSAADIQTFEMQVDSFFLENNLCLADPLSPERIVSKVNEILLTKENTPQAKQASLETDLKQFLKL